MKKMGIAVLSALVVAVVAFPQQALYDVVIHDGMIVDGTGNPWYRADVGIAGGRIQKIVDWTTVSGYVQRLQKQGVFINIAISVAPRQSKRAVIGYQNRPATPEEIVRMKKLVEQAMREGAVGLSSAFNGGGY